MLHWMAKTKHRGGTAMIVNTAVKLLSTFQRMTLAVLVSPFTVYQANGDNTELTAVNALYPGLKFVFKGTGLGVTGSDAFSGNVTSFDIVETATGLRASTLLPAVRASIM